MIRKLKLPLNAFTLPVYGLGILSVACFTILNWNFAFMTTSLLMFGFLVFSVAFYRYVPDEQISLLPVPSTASPSTSPDSITPVKLHYIEGMRGIAALLVGCHHFRLLSNSIKWNANLFWQGPHGEMVIFWDGCYHVVLFFLLSGRTLTHSLLKKNIGSTQKGVLFRQYVGSLLKRPLRLGLPLIGITIITSLLGKVGLYNSDLVSAISQPNNAWLQVPNQLQGLDELLVYILSWFTGAKPTSLNFYLYIGSSVSWTLPVELAVSYPLYTLSAIACFIRSPLLKNLFYLMIVGATFIANSDRLEFFIGLWICDLSLSGCFSAIYEVKNITLRALLWIVRLLLGIAVIVIPAWGYSFGEMMASTDSPLFIPEGWTRAWNMKYTTSGIALLILVEISPFLQEFFSAKAFRFLGKISFGYYLTHGTVMVIFLPNWFVFVNSIGCSDFLIVASGFLLFIPSSIIIGWGAHLLFDKPSVIITAKLEKYLLKDMFNEKFEH